MTPSNALRHLWWTTVILLGFVGALLAVRLLYWPPDVSDGPTIPPGGLLTFLNVLMVGFVGFCVWYYLVKPVLVVFFSSGRTLEPKACVTAIVKWALPSAGLLAIPMALAIAIDLSPPFGALPVALVFGVAWLLRPFAAKAARDMEAALF